MQVTFRTYFGKVDQQQLSGDMRAVVPGQLFIPLLERHSGCTEVAQPLMLLSVILPST